jgi:hypothetical protein
MSELRVPEAIPARVMGLEEHTALLTERLTTIEATLTDLLARVAALDLRPPAEPTPPPDQIL